MDLLLYICQISFYLFQSVGYRLNLTYLGVFLGQRDTLLVGPHIEALALSIALLVHPSLPLVVVDLHDMFCQFAVAFGVRFVDQKEDEVKP